MTNGATYRNKTDYSWADHLIYLEAGAEISVQPFTKVNSGKAPPVNERVLAGLLYTVAVSVLATFLSTIPIWPFTLAKGEHPIDPVAMALLLGMIAGNLWMPPMNWVAGIKYSIKRLLPIGIILMGVRLNFSDLLKAGLVGVVLSATETLIAITGLVWIGRWLRLPSRLAILLGVGTGICGGSAIVAVAPVIEAEERDVALSVATVSLLGLLGMFAMPFVGRILALNSTAYGTWAGLAIHQTPQVIAAGFAYSPEAGEVATVVKLARVCLLAPVVFLVGLAYRKRENRSPLNTTHLKIHYLQMIPTFLIGFFVMMMFRTLGLIPEMTLHLSKESLLGPASHSLDLVSILRGLSNSCIIISMTAVGLETKFALVRKTGPRPFLAGLLAALAISLLSLWAILLIHL